jgi:hypothetical protein
MTFSNITGFPRKDPESSPTDITLESMLSIITEWRSNKGARGEQIPVEIWKKIISLTKKYPEAVICGALGITKMQFKRKLDEFRPPISTTETAHESRRVDFCEAKESSSSHYRPARIPATNTLIVEFCRADGQIMKIHTTTDSFAELMKAFFEGK